MIRKCYGLGFLIIIICGMVPLQASHKSELISKKAGITLNWSAPLWMTNTEQNYLVMPFRKFYWFHHILQLLQHTPAPRARQVNSKRLHMLRDIKISQRCGEKSMCATFV